MHKKNVLLLLFFSLPLFFAGATGQKEESSSNSAESKKLKIYCYDSFASEWGPGLPLAEAFKAKTGVNIDFTAPGDAGTVLATVIMEKKNPQADLIIGPDNNLLAKALNEDVLSPYKSPALKDVPQHLQFDPTNHLTPFDWSFFAICYDSEKITNPPQSLEDLCDPQYSKSLVVMDPRTSSPGQGFLLWTRAVYGEDYLKYWQKLKPSILTVTESWTTGYGLFTSGEANLVLSYTTSPVYHKMYEESDRYKALIFEKGNYMQIEGVGLIKGGQNQKNAKAFIDFMLSPEGQAIIAVNNIMLPVNPATDLPEAFSVAENSDSPLLLDAEEISEFADTWTQDWVEKSGL